jgi:hypothetical protein
MEYQITIHSDLKYIEIMTKGFLDKDSSLDMAKTISKTMRHHRIKNALIDHRNVTNVSGEVTEIYDRPKLFSLIGVIFGIRMAVIIKSDHIEHFRFLETVCLNQGYNYTVFYDRSSALEWLLSK